MNRLSIILMILVGCKSYQPPIYTEPDKKEVDPSQPDWVRQKPTSSNHYIGIGNASLSDPDYQSNAKFEALDDLGSEISVTIESASLLSQIENTTGFREQFRSTIKATSKQSLELYEQVESWSDDRVYWVQYRLNKSEFHEARAKKKKQAIDLAKDFFIKGTAAENVNDHIQAMHFYAQSIENLRDYINEKNEVSIEGTTILLATEAYSRLLSFISKTSLKADTSSYSFSPGENIKVITIQAVDDSKASIKSLPVNTSPYKNHGGVTDLNGEIHVRINRKVATTNLLAEPDFSFLKDYPISWKLIGSVKSQQLTIQFSIPPITIDVISEEKNLTKSMHQQVAAAALKKILADEGYRIAESSPEYILEIRSDTRKGSELSGLYTSFLDLNVQIKNKDQKVIYSDSFLNIKGIHTSYETAGIKAYQHIQKEYSDAIRQSLKENFMNKE